MVATIFLFFIIKLFSFLNINDPFILAFLLRLVSSLIGFISIYVLFIYFKDKLNLDNNFSKFVIFLFGSMHLYMQEHHLKIYQYQC